MVDLTDERTFESKRLQGSLHTAPRLYEEAVTLSF